MQSSTHRWRGDSTLSVFTGSVHNVHSAIRGPHHLPDQRTDSQRFSGWNKVPLHTWCKYFPLKVIVQPKIEVSQMFSGMRSLCCVAVYIDDCLLIAKWVDEPVYLAGCRCAGVLLFLLGLWRSHLLLQLQLCAVSISNSLLKRMLIGAESKITDAHRRYTKRILSFHLFRVNFSHFSFHCLFLQQQLWTGCSHYLRHQWSHLRLLCYRHLLHHRLQGNGEVWRLLGWVHSYFLLGWIQTFNKIPM